MSIGSFIYLRFKISMFKRDISYIYTCHVCFYIILNKQTPSLGTYALTEMEMSYFFLTLALKNTSK